MQNKKDMDSQIMDTQYEELEAEYESGRAARIREMRYRKRRQKQLRRIITVCLVFGAGALAVIFLVVSGVKLVHGLITGKNSAVSEDVPAEQLKTEQLTPEQIQEWIKAEQAENGLVKTEQLQDKQQEQTAEEEKEQEKTQVYTAAENEDTVILGESIISSQAILIDRKKDVILAEKGARTVIVPASMTKVLTVLVAAEQVSNLEDTFTMTADITDYCYVNDCSIVGFEEGEEVKVRDLFYGTILQSGADAAMGLAQYAAGSQEAFVDKMNEKLAELGLAETAHFTNCIGIYDKNHYCTVYDMAMIMDAAMDNALCKEVLSAHTYTTGVTEQHPEGITISNWFLRRIEDKDAGGEVVGGKTGYVVQSGNCAVSYAEDAGRQYICATADSTSGWRCIYDHVDIYHRFFKAK